MKKLFLLVSLIFIAISCSSDEDLQRHYFAKVPVQNVEIPQEFIMGETYTITVWYYKPKTCYHFDQFLYEQSLNTRIIAIQNYIVDDPTCQTLSNQLESESFDFFVSSNGSYVFKFWQGVDENLEDVFYEIEVPVTE